MGDDMTIPTPVKRAIAAVKSEGIAVTLATGRAFGIASGYARELEIDVPLICFQGGLIQPVDGGRPLYRATMERECVRDVLRSPAAQGTEVAVFAGGRVFLSRHRQSREFYRRFLGSRLRWVDDLGDVVDRYATMKVILFVEPERAEETMRELRQGVSDEIAIVRSHEILVECHPRGVSKGDALRRLAEHLDVPRANVMAIGDQANDASMVAWAGIGVAMGNAVPETKAVADWIAPPLEEDGVVRAIDRFVLERELE